MSTPDPIQCFLNDPAFRQCCCNCRYHQPVHYHCGTKPAPPSVDVHKCVCSIRKGWACVPPDHGGVIFDNWHEHSVGCEMYVPKDKQ